MIADTVVITASAQVAVAVAISGVMLGVLAVRQARVIYRQRLLTGRVDELEAIEAGREAERARVQEAFASALPLRSLDDLPDLPA